MCTYYSIMARLGAIICRQDADHWIGCKEFMRIDLDAWHLSATNKLGFVLQYCNWCIWSTSKITKYQIASYKRISWLRESMEKIWFSYRPTFSGMFISCYCKPVSWYFAWTSWNISYLNCCWFELAPSLSRIITQQVACFYDHALLRRQSSPCFYLMHDILRQMSYMKLLHTLMMNEKRKLELYIWTTLFISSSLSSCSCLLAAASFSCHLGLLPLVVDPCQSSAEYMNFCFLPSYQVASYKQTLFSVGQYCW